MKGVPKLRHSNFSCWGTSVMFEGVYSFPLAKGTQLISQKIPGAVGKTASDCVGVFVPKAPEGQQMTLALHALRALAMKRGAWAWE